MMILFKHWIIFSPLISFSATSQLLLLVLCTNKEKGEKVIKNIKTKIRNLNVSLDVNFVTHLT